MDQTLDIPVVWLLPGRICYSPGHADTRAMAIRNRKVLSLIESEGQKPFVHNLIDHSNRYTPQERAQQEQRLQYYMSIPNDDDIRDRLLSHPMLGWVISIATPNTGLKMAGAVISQQRNYRWHSVDTIAEALAFLQARDPSLPDLSDLVIPDLD